MARTFLGIPFSPWLGQPSARPFSTCGRDAVAVPINVVWSVYGAGSTKPNVAVDVLMTATGQRSLIDSVKSVYVDNLGVNFPVYVYFPSTGFTVAAKANSAVWYPAITNDLNALIVGEGIADGDIAANATTVVYFSNLDRVPYVDEEISQGVMLGRASTNVSRGGNFSNSFYGAAALGDQSNQASISLVGANSSALFRAGPGPGGRQNSGFYYMTGLYIAVANVTGSGIAQVLVQNVDSGLTICAPFFTAPVANYIAYSMSGFNEKLDATQLWNFTFAGAGGITAGSATAHVRYTYQS